MTGEDAFTRGGPGLRVALVVRFLLELALLTGAAVAARRMMPGAWGWPVAVVTVLLVAVVWGTFLSPKARVQIPAQARLAVEALLFGGAGVALWATGLGIAGLVLIVTWILDRIAIAVMR